MDVKKVKEKKMALEASISDQIRKFEQETGVQIVAMKWLKSEDSGEFYLVMMGGV